ncbi:hypothetical protein HY339_03180 [Candidatus Gottesmanbacteria bacterium]|nr:hypothetical protein [Candidatus Gottesmanbacteria bacterium]
MSTASEQESHLEIGEPQTIRSALEEACRKQANNIVASDISAEPRGSNIFMGIGLVSQRGVSPGLGFGFIPMACVAAEVQRAFGETGLSSEITVLIADQHARTARPDEAHKIERATEVTGQSARRLFDVLGANAHVVNASDSGWPKMNGQSYESLEATDMLHAHVNLHCGVKVGWQTKRKSLKPDAVIRDERWFDEQAKAIMGTKLDGMSFLRVHEWMSRRSQLDASALPKRSIKTVEVFIPKPYGPTEVVRRKVSVNTSPQHLPLPPYIGEKEFCFGGRIDVRGLADTGAFSQSMLKRLAEFDHTLKRMLGIRERMEGFQTLQGVIDICASR